jgi:hypothetical protein
MLSQVILAQLVAELIRNHPGSVEKSQEQSINRRFL